MARSSGKSLPPLLGLKAAICPFSRYQPMREHSAIHRSDDESAAYRLNNVEVDLIEAQNVFAIIDISVQGSKECYQSTIVSVDPVARVIALGEVFPATFPCLSGLQITATLRLSRNRRVVFSTRLLEKNKPRSDVKFHLEMPVNFTYNQRREAYRFKIPAPHQGYAELYDRHSFYCSGIVRDISLTGMRLSLDHKIGPTKDDVIERLSFELNGDHFSCRGRIKNMTCNIEGYDVIGIEFIDMPRTQQRVLEKTLTQQQRVVAKQKAQR